MAGTSKIPGFGSLRRAVRRRARLAMARGYLIFRRHVVDRGTVWIRHERVLLPFSGDGDDQELMYYLDGKKWWRNEMRAMGPYVAEGSVVVDVGANLGFMSSILSLLTGRSGHVFSFEPSPRTYPKLVEVIGKNRFENVTPHNLACGAEESQMELFSPSSSGDASLRPNDAVKGHSFTVRIVKLDDFLGPKLDRLDFIKIDTEGFEDEVLKGASDLIQNFKPVIYIELGSAYLASSQRAISLLQQAGYSFRPEVDLNVATTGENFFAVPEGWGTGPNRASRLIRAQ